VSTLHDLQIWSKALATGTLLKPATQRERLTWVKFPSPIRYGLAIFDAGGFLGHNGQLPGFQSFMGYRPSDGATIIVLTNLNASQSGKEPADEIAKVILKRVFP
jgi:D-alanyl-D-alanine carboxypeptidase